MRLGHVKLFVRYASHTGIRTYIMVAVAVHGNLHYHRIEIVLLHYVQFRIREIITVASAGHVNSLYYHIGILSHLWLLLQRIATYNSQTEKLCSCITFIHT